MKQLMGLPDIVYYTIAHWYDNDRQTYDKHRQRYDNAAHRYDNAAHRYYSYLLQLKRHISP